MQAYLAINAIKIIDQAKSYCLTVSCFRIPERSSLVVSQASRSVRVE